jgi:hypothetical protein
MATTVTVSAHCDPDTTRVEVQVIDGDNDGQNTYLEDGESTMYLVYDDRKIIVAEIPILEETDRIFSGDNSKELWDEINALTAQATGDDVQHVIYYLCCKLQALEAKLESVVERSITRNDLRQLAMREQNHLKPEEQ